MGNQHFITLLQHFLSINAQSIDECAVCRITIHNTNAAILLLTQQCVSARSIWIGKADVIIQFLTNFLYLDGIHWTVIFRFRYWWFHIGCDKFLPVKYHTLGFTAQTNNLPWLEFRRVGNPFAIHESAIG